MLYLHSIGRFEIQTGMSAHLKRTAKLFSWVTAMVLVHAVMQSVGVMMLMMILLLNCYGHKPIGSKFFGFSDAPVLYSLFHFRDFFCLVLFHDVFCCLD